MNYSTMWTGLTTSENPNETAYRDSWPDSDYLWNDNGTVYKTTANGTVPYSPTQQDESANNWELDSDKPPHR